MIFRRAFVRLHLTEQHPSVEGVLAGKNNGHYRLLKPVVIESEERSRSLDGELWVPRERVVYVQRLG